MTPRSHMRPQAAASLAAVENRIQTLRGQRVLLDADLAELYGVETRTLLQSVKRNLLRFPSDFMFQLTAEEFANLRSQIVISSFGRHGGRRTASPKRPIGFTADVNGGKP